MCKYLSIVEVYIILLGIERALFVLSTEGCSRYVKRGQAIWAKHKKKLPALSGIHLFFLQTLTNENFTLL